MRLSKMLVLGMLVGVISITSVGCSTNNNSSTEKESTEYDRTELNTKLDKAIDNILTLDKTYVVNTSVVANGNSTAYMDIIADNGVSYSEFPVDKDGNSVDLQNISEDDINNIQYSLSDWMTKDGKYYVLGTNSSTGGVGFQLMPDSYAKLISNRKQMFLNLLKDKFINIRESNKTLNVNDADKMEVYECEVKGKDIAEYLGVQTKPIYEAIKEENKEDEGIVKLCDYYIEDYSRTLTFSDAKVTIGIEEDIIRYIDIEVGGLGSKMYLTRTITKDADIDVREEPDLKDSLDYVENQIKVVADFCSSYNSIEEGLNAYYSNSSSQETGNTQETDNKNSSKKKK